MKLKLTKKQKEDLVVGLVAGLVVGLVYGLVAGLAGGLVYGLTITTTTQILAMAGGNPEFALLDLIVNGVLLIAVQITGWWYVRRLEK